jgi:TPR repeat protein
MKEKSLKKRKISSIEEQRCDEDEEEIVIMFYHLYGIQKYERDLEKSKKICHQKVLERNETAIGLKYYEGWGCEKDLERSLENFERANERKGLKEKEKSMILEMIATIKLKKGDKEEQIQAIKLYERACELKNSIAMNNLARIYKTGMYGVEKDLDKAVKLYEQASLLLNSSAMVNLSYICMDKNALFKPYHDVSKSISLLELCCELNNPSAINNLAHFYRSGIEGMEKNIHKAIELYERAVSLGNKFKIKIKFKNNFKNNLKK